MNPSGFRSGLALVVATLVSVQPAAGQALTSDAPSGVDVEGSHAELERRLDKLAVEYVERYKIPALCLAVRSGDLDYARAFGRADIEHDVPATTATLFRTASIAKSLTAAAVLRLSEAGLLSLDAPIQEYCPALPAKRWPLTARQLLGHLGGVRHYRPGEVNGTTHYFSVEDSLAIFKNDPLEHEPGSEFLYSTFGYSVLGCAVEGASGKPYETYLQASILDPSGMRSTFIDDHFLLRRGRASGYMRIDESDLEELPPSFASKLRPGQVLNAMLLDTSMKTPGGGLLSTPSDLLSFVRALEDGTLVSREALELMWSSASTSQATLTGYGLGWDLETIAGAPAVFHTGSQAGARGGLYVFRDRGLQLAALSNLVNWPIQDFAAEIVRIFETMPATTARFEPTR